MGESVKKGSLLLLLAQVWHALSGYVIFIAGFHILGDESYSGFMLVIWTMTTLEILVVDGVPRAISWFVARNPECSRETLRKGLGLTAGIALVLGVLLGVFAPVISREIWGNPELTGAVRISGLDFLAFAGFAAVTQAVNGLRRYTAQAITWLCYSTAKVALVLGMLWMGEGIQGAVLGYVMASLVGSAIAWVLGGRLMGNPVRRGGAPTARELTHYGWPLALQAFALMAFLNADLWAVEPHMPAVVAGAYAAAATLGRALFFIFKSVGDAMFPAVAQRAAQGDPTRALEEARTALGWLLLLLLPVTGLAIGAAAPTMAVIYGELHASGPEVLRWLAPASSIWTITAFLGLLLAALGSPYRVALTLLAVASISGVVLYNVAEEVGTVGVAQWALAASLVGMVALAAQIAMCAGVGFLPWRQLLFGIAAAVALAVGIQLWQPPGILVFPYGALLLAVVLVLATRLFMVPKRA